MAMLKRSGMRIIDDALAMGGGYVLSFSDRTYSEFFDDEFRIDIDDSRYRARGTSKVNRLRSGVCQSSCHLNLFHAASRSGPAMGAPPPASWGSASAPPRPCCSSLGRSGLSQTDPTGSQFRVLPDQRAGLLARAA